MQNILVNMQKQKQKKPESFSHQWNYISKTMMQSVNMSIADQKYLAKINQWIWCVPYRPYFATLSIIVF